jgi:beta-lactam-binding protein with PASTA domain
MKGINMKDKNIDNWIDEKPKKSIKKATVKTKKKPTVNDKEQEILKKLDELEKKKKKLENLEKKKEATQKIDEKEIKKRIELEKTKSLKKVSVNKTKTLKKTSLDKTKKINKIEDIKSEVFYPKYKKTLKDIIVTVLLVLVFIISLIYVGYNFMNETTFNTLYSIIISMLALSVLCIKTSNDKALFTGISMLLAVILITIPLLVKYDVLTPPETINKVPELTGTTITEALAWGNENKITINQVYDYSEVFEKFQIISQNIKVGVNLGDTTEITLVISDGPNPYKEVILENFVGQNIDEVILKIYELSLNNVQYLFESSESIDKDLIITQSVSGQTTRDALLVITTSIGSKDTLQPVELINLKGKTLDEAIVYLGRNGIEYKLEYEFDETDRYTVVSQSDKEGTTIDPLEDTLTLIISKGKEIIAPNILNMTSDQLIMWITENKLNIKFNDVYSVDKMAGDIIESNYNEGDKLEQGDTIEVTVSKGQLTLPEFGSLTEFRTWASKNNVKYKENYEYNSLAQGKIISISINTGDIINLENEIILKISNGQAITTPSLIGLTKTEALTKCKNAGFTCYYSNYYSNSTVGEVIYQTITAGTKVIQGTTLSMRVSIGVKVDVNACTSTETHTLYISPSLIVPNNYEATKSALEANFKSNYPKVTINIIGRTGNLTIGYIHEDSSITSGSTIKDCESYTLILTK